VKTLPFLLPDFGVFAPQRSPESTPALL
jgi:hypothetical protein